jgi:predicted nucleic acid-binding protein
VLRAEPETETIERALDVIIIRTRKKPVDGPSQRRGRRVAKVVGGRLADLAACVRTRRELYAGIAPRGRHVLERFERDFRKARRILAPNLNDWTQTGKVLACLAAKYDYEKIGHGRLTIDALIAMSAARQAITVINANARDFPRLAEFRPFQWKVHDFGSS